MPKVIITESQFKKLYETGAANAAMDLDIYVQPVHHDTSHGNENLQDTLEDMKAKLIELISMFKTGKKIKSEQKGQIFKFLDDLKLVYDEIKKGV